MHSGANSGEISLNSALTLGEGGNSAQAPLRLGRYWATLQEDSSNPRMPLAASAPSSSAPPLIKVALVGDSGVGKTSLMVRYVEGTFDETQLPTQGVNFSEKTIHIQGHEITFSVWDIGGSHFESMLPLVCNDAAAVLLMFDLCRRESLESIRKWHEKARSFNKCAVPFLVGCKFDQLGELPEEEQRHIEDLAQAFAQAIRAPLIFCAPSVPINVINVFKVILTQLFGLRCAVPQLRLPGQPLLLYETPDVPKPTVRGNEDLRDAVSTPTPLPSPAAAAADDDGSRGGSSPLASLSGSVLPGLPNRLSSEKSTEKATRSTSGVSGVSSNYAAQYGV